MAYRTVRVETSLPGWPRDMVLTVDDAIPFIGALLTAGRLIDYVPPTPGVVQIDPNAAVRVADLQNSSSAAMAVLAAIFLGGDGVVSKVKSLTQVAYDALPVKDPATLYLVG